jgi:putative transposase
MVWETLQPAPDALRMPGRPGHHHRHQFPAALIAHAVWLYQRFALSFRGVAELLHERGIEVTHETIRAWVAKFGANHAAELRKRAARPGRTWHLDEVLTRGRKAGLSRVYLWRAVGRFSNRFRLRRHRLTAAEYRAVRHIRSASWREPTGAA